MSEPPKSAGEMMADIMGHVGSLIRSEVDLARAEMTLSLAKAGSALVAMALAFALGLVALNLLAAFTVGLAVRAGLPLAWAPLAVAVFLLVLAAGVFASARTRLHGAGILPLRTARSIQREAAALKEAYDDK